MIKQIGLPLRGRPILLITRMITNRIGLHSVLLPLLIIIFIIIIIIITSDTGIKVNFNYFTLYKASSLNLKIIWSKRVSFFVFLRSHTFIRRSHGSRLSVIVRSDTIYFYWNEWMKIDRSFLYTNHVQWHTKLTRVVQGGSFARFTNRKNSESRITAIKISFSRIK